jgi:hypothetical protein
MTDDPKILIGATVAVVAIVAISIGVILHDTPATGAADNAPVPSRGGTGAPSLTMPMPPMPPMPYVRKPVEQAPAVTGAAPGDGAWMVGRDIQRGVYRSRGGRSCHWARLQGRPGAAWTVVSPPARLGPQVVVLGGSDVAFASRGCTEWVRIR